MAVERRPNFDFIEMGIPVGSELVAVSNPNIKVTVKDNRKVLYNGKEYYLSGLEDELHLIGKPCGHWYFEGKGRIYNSGNCSKVWHSSESDFPMESTGNCRTG